MAGAHETDLNVSRLVDVDDDDGPAGEGVALDGDDTGWSQSAATRQPFVPKLAQCNQTIELSDAQINCNPALTGTAALTSFTSFNDTGMLSIDGSSMSDGSTNTQDVRAVATGGVSGGTITNCAGITGPDAHPLIGPALAELFMQVMFALGALARPEREMVAAVAAAAQDCHY